MDIKIGDIVLLKEWAGHIRDHLWDTGNLDKDLTIEYVIEDIDFNPKGNDGPVVKIGGTAFRSQYLKELDPFSKDLRNVRKLIYED